MKLNFNGRILGALALLGLVAFGSTAFALTVPATFPARVLQTQTTVHFRKTVNFNDANIATGVKIGAIPAGAFITSIKCYVTTAFNAATTNNLLIGSTATGGQFLASGVTAGTNCVAATAGYQSITAAAGLGFAVTAPTNTPTGTSGAWDVFVSYTQTGTAATAGQVTYVIEYVASDDQ
jgi:hypothetical protein